jgi:copper chaperone CopZ
MRIAARAVLAGALALGGGLSVWAGEPAKTTLAVQGMNCGGCVAAVKVQLERSEGVTAYEVSLEKAEAEVSYDPEQTIPEKIAESVSKTGFNASLKKSADTSSSAASEGVKCGTACQRDCCKAPKHGAAVAAEAPGLVSLAQGLDPLVSAFNDAKARPRFVAILSPSCSACVHGAEAIKEAVLPAGDAVDVFVVWAPMLEADGAAAASSSSTIVEAPHVRQYWDSERRTGSAFRRDVFPDAVERMKRSVPKDHFFAEYLDQRDATQPEWDIYLFFEPGVEWAGRAPVPARFLRQTALFAEGTDGGQVSLMWKNDYASAPIEGSLSEELRKLSPVGPNRTGAAR